MQNMVLNQKLYNLLSDLKQPWFWLVLSEPWCGDASWGTPALYIIASASEQITFKILLRDSHPEIMTKFQTESSDSIPKLICLRKSNLEVLGTWGPRPSILHQQVMTFKNHAQFDYKESVRKIHAWYEKDMTRTTQEEITDLVKIWREKS